MATEAPTTTNTTVHDFSPAMAPLASRFDNAMAAMDERIVANRALDPEAADEAIAGETARVDEVVVLIAATPLATKADAELALRALAWTVGARSEAEIAAQLGHEENGTDARLLDALFARALVA